MRVLFIYKRSRHEGVGYLYCRITINKMACKPFTTGVKVAKSEWNAKQQRITGPTSSFLMPTLTNLVAKLQTLALRFEQSGKEPTAKAIREVYLRKEKRHTIALDIAVAAYLAHQKKRMGAGEIKPATVVGTNKYVNYVLAWLQGRTVYPYDLKTTDITALIDFHRARGLADGTLARFLKWLRGFMGYLIRRGLMRSDPTAGMVIRIPEKEILYLDADTLTRFEALAPHTPRLQAVKDCFLAQCYTGLAYADLAALCPNHAQTKEGMKWIRIDRAKAKQGTTLACYIPVLAATEALLARYGWKLPVLSNQKYNAYLKELGDLAGVSFELTTHVGRKTFAATMIERGFSLEAVAAMLGHKNTKTLLQFYARVREKRIKLEMQTLGVV